VGAVPGRCLEAVVSPVYDVPSEQGMRTPAWLVKLLEQRIGRRFQVDLFASPHDAVCKRYLTVRDDALTCPWPVVGAAFANPPFKLFGRAIEKAFAEATSARQPDIVVCLLGPSGCSQRWFHTYARRGTVLKPTRRLAYLKPDGKTTAGAMADTAAYIFGRGWWNDVKACAAGRFRVETLEVPDETD
jgi:phage N-6-adenine-methyltransferase